MVPNTINTAMGLIDAVVVGSLDLEAHGYDIADIAAHVGQVRTRLDVICQQSMDFESRKFDIMDEPSVTTPDLATHFPRPNILSEVPITMASMQQRAMANSGALPCFPISNTLTPQSFQLALNWIASDTRLNNSSGPDAQLLVLHSIDRLMWFAANHLIPSVPPLSLSAADVAALDTLVTDYSSRVAIWLKCEGKLSLMVKYRSHEVLVTWIAFSLVHWQCCM
ncbi:Aste57867_7440 [Aphanomyces stellatus]|uniref:Aste57867_7440 protein n=1 Tax=Aphanomyces stellatus TaxID=120398 RepID=A0A485KIB0_9STRA|nr:hypothetical protein As57867_007414 [Aphanomyces stellatus]VFT84352.1 Aste57867_7440 [Aphanomyces stellatus]